MAKVAVVSGGGSGIGRQTVARLLIDGWTVWSFDTSSPADHGDVESGANLHHEQCDVRDPSSLRAAYQRVASVAGCIDAVVCSAGVTRVGELDSMSIDDAKLMLDVNLTGVWLTIREALPLLRKNASPETPSRVVVVGSIGGIRLKVAQGFYGATKAAVHALAQVFAAELGPQGITVNVVAPSSTNTPMHARTKQDGAGTGFVVSGVSPLGRIAEPDDIASAILFLLGDGAQYVNGVVLPVDGGTRAAYNSRPWAAAVATVE